MFLSHSYQYVIVITSSDTDRFLADHTPCSMIGYWHDTVDTLSVCHLYTYINEFITRNTVKQSLNQRRVQSLGGRG